jgi:hypothetical protein
MSRKKKGSSSAEQLEFDFVASVTNSPRPGLSERRRGRNASRLAAGCPVDEEWIESSCDRIRRARDLREAVALAACYLADLIDYDIEVRGYGEQWNHRYQMYCVAKYDGYFEKEGQTLGVPGLVWLTARRIFKIYERSNQITDWALFQDLCTCKAMELEDLDGGNSDAALTEFLCCCVWGAHDLLINAGSWIFRARDSDSEALKRAGSS